MPRSLSQCPYSLPCCVLVFRRQFVQDCGQPSELHVSHAVLELSLLQGFVASPAVYHANSIAHAVSVGRLQKFHAFLPRSAILPWTEQMCGTTGSAGKKSATACCGLAFGARRALVGLPTDAADGLTEAAANTGQREYTGSPITRRSIPSRPWMANALSQALTRPRNDGTTGRGRDETHIHTTRTMALAPAK